MAKEVTKEQFWNLYEKLPKELKEAIFSEETANNIFDFCVKNGIEDNRISEVARYTGRVLLGILGPDEFQKTLEDKLKIKKEVAKKITREINRFIFYPVRTNLEELHKVAVVPPPAQMEKTASPAKERQTTPSGSDTYRELIE